MLTGIKVKRTYLELEANTLLSDFDKLLLWLNDDRDRAGKTYVLLQRALIRRFRVKGCESPSELADETIERVTSKADWLLMHYVGDPARYFFGVARRVFLESTRKAKAISLSDNIADISEDRGMNEILDNILTRSLEALHIDEAKFILDYYKGEKSDKIRNRQEMCDRFSLSQQALRVRAFRIREKLKKSITETEKSRRHSKETGEKEKSFSLGNPESLYQPIQSIQSARSQR